MSESRALAASCSESSPSSPASRPATRDSSEVKSCCARSARAAASARAWVSRPTSSSAAAARLRSPLTCPCRRAMPSRRSAAARCSPVTRRSSSPKACSAAWRAATAPSSAVRLPATSAVISSSWTRTRAASASSSSGLRPSGTSGWEAALRTRSAARPAVPRRRSRRPDRANQVSWACEQRGQVLAQRRLEGRLGLAGGGQRRLDLGAALDQDRLVGQLLLERGPRRGQVVGHQPGPGVADVGLHHGCAPGHLGLAPEGLELSPDLAEQVGEPGQVALGGVELAERLLLALAVLEDPGRLLDEAAPVLRGRVQDRVELSLPDDDVHLPADAGVAQQLLDVQQAAASCR